MRISIPELEEAAKHYQHGRIWTQEEEDILREYYRRVAPDEIAKYLKRTVNSIYNKAGSMGLSK